MRSCDPRAYEFLVAPATVGVLDLPIRSLAALAACYGLVSRWTPSLDGNRTLGSCLKVIPAAEAEMTTGWLRWAGLLPPENRDGEVTS